MKKNLTALNNIFFLCDGILLSSLDLLKSHQHRDCNHYWMNALKYGKWLSYKAFMLCSDHHGSRNNLSVGENFSGSETHSSAVKRKEMELGLVQEGQEDSVRFQSCMKTFRQLSIYFLREQVLIKVCAPNHTLLSSVAWLWSLYT